MRRFLLSAAALALSTTAFAAPATAQDAADQSSGMAADIAAAVAADGRSEADRALDASRMPVEVLTFMGLERGDLVLDLMAGGGYYSEIMGHAVGPNSAVIAQSPPQFMNTAEAMEHAAGLVARTGNVLLMPAHFTNINLGENRYDFVMMHLVYHDLYWESEQYQFPRIEPADILAQVFAAMKPGGTVAVVDHIADPNDDTRATTQELHRIDPAVVRADFEAAGFVLEEESDLLRVAEDDHSLLVFNPAVRGNTDRFMMRFRRP